MAVYVDRLRDWGWEHGASAHLIADTAAELHEFAARLGVARKWLHTARFPHYDLTAVRRAAAVRLGAVELSNREFIQAIRRLEAGRRAAAVTSPGEGVSS